jgi:hypothetical protein
MKILTFRPFSGPSMSFTLHKLRKRIAAVIGQTADWALFVGIVLIGGLGSSWYVIDNGVPISTVTIGPWTTWPSAGRPDADPYTRAHHARLGKLPLSAEFSQTYFARTDSEGRALVSSCDYSIEGHELASHWWSIGVFDSKGRLIANPAERFAFTSDTIVLSPDGSYSVVLSRDTRPGNWLPTGGGGRLAIGYSVLDLGIRSVAQEGEIERQLPIIKRKSC